MTTTPNEIFEYIKDKKCPMCKECINDAKEINTFNLMKNLGYYATNILCGSCNNYSLRIEFADPKKKLNICETVWFSIDDDDDDEKVEYSVKLDYSTNTTSILNQFWPYKSENVLKLDGILFNPLELTEQEMLEKVETYLLFR